MVEQTRTTSYSCCRDGKYRENCQQRVTEGKRKRQISRKLANSYCIARITAVEFIDTGKIVVDYISTHTNHELDAHECINLPLPSSTHKDIREKLAQGIPIARIMDGM